MFRIISLLALLSTALGQLTVTQPSSSLWWVSNSLNTLVWASAQGNTITQFSVFLSNSDVNVLNNKLALISIQPTYDYSKTISPINVPAAQNYVIQLTDPLNSSSVYASSQPFEIKAAGSAYPTGSVPINNTNGTATVTGSASASATSSASAASASSSKSAAAGRGSGMSLLTAAGAGGVALVVAAAAM
ncbi:hypothetical protein EHS25_003225 [Saitozyma podzolica]|uniref:Ser-Thr-rich glycosyl-phosphatidyl-inositol-anchored membrane family-domain-containing protein n=1 Tax=Saitozyma podzolica TaxID=1890683 RepID=A0A427Y891_9TREE|nr:hypothetical protein EHS25_003225 [Saitozyma podzolica]